MALVTWEDIGGSVRQAESNMAQGAIPDEQNFPVSTDSGTLSISTTSGEDTFNTYLNTFQTLSYTKNSNNAFIGGYVALKGAYSSSNNQSLCVYGIKEFLSSLWYQKTNGLFILRVPRNKSNAVLYDFMLCSAFTYNHPNAWSNLGDTSSFVYVNNTSYALSASSCIAIQKGTLPYNYSNVSGDSSSNWYQYLSAIQSGVSSAGYGNLRLVVFNKVLYCFPFNTLGIYANFPIEQSYLVDTNLPIWDITEESHLDDILTYLSSGVINNAWFGSESAYEPAVDATLTDTTTTWKLQALGDTNPKYRLVYLNNELGSKSASIRRQWRGNIYVDSIINPLTNEVFRQFDKSDVILYDKPYLYHSALWSAKYTDIFDKAWQFIYSNIGSGEYVPSSSEGWIGNAWLSKQQAYIIRIGMCVCCSNQISNIVYVDLKYDTTDGLSWGTLKDYGDDSNVVITIVNDTTIDEEGGEENIEIPEADDGYTGVIDVVPSDSDFDYDEGGSGQYPEDTITPVSGSGVSIGGKFCTTYQVSTAQLKAISTYFWDDGSDGFISKYINAVNNPIESILSVGYMPISVSGSSGSDSIFIGNVNLTEQASDCTGYTIDNTTRTITVGTLDIPEVYNSFLDYQPYTNLSIFLPYIGFKTLPPNLFMGKTIKVEYAFDLITGACKALLSANGKFVLSFDGDCMIKIPLTASNNSDVFMQRLRSAVEAGVALASAGIGSMAITSGGGKHVTGEQMGRTHKEAQLGRAMRRTSTWNEVVEREPTVYNQHAYGGAVSQVVGSGLDIAMAKHTYETYGGASSATASVEPMAVYIVIDSPTVQYPSTYNHNCGKPCELSKYLSSLTGYTEVDGGIDLSGIPCTEAERDEIHRLLVSGVYL